MATAAQTQPNPRNPSRLRGLLAIGWVIGLVTSYFAHYDGWLPLDRFAQLALVSPPPLGTGRHLVAFLLGRLADTACVAALFASAFGVGAVAVDKLLPERTRFTALFALGAGLWIMATSVLVVGAFSVAKLPVAFCGLLAWVLPAPRKLLRALPGPNESLDAWGKAMLACIIVAGLLSLPGTFAPPFEYDELEYHLGAPAEYIRAGHIVFLPHNFYSNMPQLTEMLYLLGMVTSTDGAAKLLHWAFGVLAAGAVYSVATRLWTRKIGITAAALFYCTPFVQDLSQTARVDLATTFFGVLAFAGLLIWWTDGERRYLWLSALSAGAAISTKWTAAPVVLLPAVAVLLARRRLWMASGYFLVAAVVVLPWAIKNWLLAGNPVYPLLYSVFRSPFWSAEQAGLFAAKHYPAFGWREGAGFLGLIWQYSFSEPCAVPLLLMVAPLILLVRHADSLARRAGWLFVAAYAGWFVLTFRPWRFLFPAFPLAAMIGACALEQVTGERLVRFVIRGAVLLVMVVSLAVLGMNDTMDVEEPTRTSPRISFLSYALGQSSRDEFVARMGRGTFEPVVWMNQNLPATAKVLYVGEARAYHARHEVVWCTAFDKFPPTNDVTHVYVNYSELNRLRNHYGYPRGLDVEELLGRAREIHRSRFAAVYAL